MRLSACTLLVRDLVLALRNRTDVLTTLIFFVIVASLFPLGIGSDKAQLREIAPGVIWVAALLASMLSLGRMFASDYEDGALEQLLLSPRSLAILVSNKIVAHWLVSCLPLVLLAPVLALQFDLPGNAILILIFSLLIGTPVLSVIGGIGAALTLGVRGGNVLISLLVLPLYVPILIFGTLAVQGSMGGLNTAANLSLLGALLVLALFFGPMAIAAALRISME